MENQNPTFVAPMGEINLNAGTFTAPSNYTERPKNPNIQLLPVGNNLGVVYGIVDLGTQLESFGGAAPELKRKIKIMIEHPQFQQQFYLDDPSMKSNVSSFESTFNTGEKSRLRALIAAVEGNISNQQADNYNIAQLLGKRVNSVIEHRQGKKDPTKFYENIKYVASAQGLAIPANFVPQNPYLFFVIDAQGENFKTKNFADLPFFLRKKIMESEEGKQYAARGGKFAENPKQENQQQTNQAQPNVHAQAMAPAPTPAPLSAPAPATANVNPYSNGKIELISKDYTLKVMYDNGWNDQLLVQQGMARLLPQAPPAGAPMPNAPIAPSAPMAPSAPAMNDAQAAFQSEANFNIDEEHDDLPF